MQRLSSWPLLWLFSSLRWISTRDRLRAQIKKRDDAERKTSPRGEPGPDRASACLPFPRRRDALGSCDSTSVSIATALLQALPSRLLVRDRDAVFRVRGEETL
jgi:hypothetical protein